MTMLFNLVPVPRRLLAGLGAAFLFGASVAHAAPTPLDTSAKEAIIVDYKTGTVLYQKDADKPIAPASLTKLMTVYVIFEKLKAGEIKLTDEYPVSVAAWKKGGAASGSSTMFLKINQQVTLDDLLKGIIIQSGNDACQVAAEGISGSEDAFAEIMNADASVIPTIDANVHAAYTPENL